MQLITEQKGSRLASWLRNSIYSRRRIFNVSTIRNFTVQDRDIWRVLVDELVNTPINSQLCYVTIETTWKNTGGFVYVTIETTWKNTGGFVYVTMETI